MNDETRSAESLIAADQAAQRLGITLHDAQPGRVEVGLVVTAEMLNFGDTCHGGVLFHLADTAMSVVSNQDQSPAVATAANIDYLSPAREGDDVRAVVTTTVSGRNSVHDGEIRAAVDGSVIALFRGKTLQLKER